MKYVKSSILCPNCEKRKEIKVPKEISRGKKSTFIFCECNVKFQVESWQFEKITFNDVGR
jgi:hypothetical protein